MWHYFITSSFCLLFNLLYAQKILIYDKATDGKHIQMTWIVNEIGKQVSLEGSNPNSTTSILYNPYYSMVSLKYHSMISSFDYTLKREGNLIKSEGYFKEKRYNRQHRLGKEPWIQEFNFGMRPFLSSNARKNLFCLINPKTGDLIKMIANKENVEFIRLKGKSLQAQKVKISLQGFKGLFWSAHAWYHLDSHDLLLYKGTEGPNTPLTVVTFVSKD